MWNWKLLLSTALVTNVFSGLPSMAFTPPASLSPERELHRVFFCQVDTKAIEKTPLDEKMKAQILGLVSQSPLEEKNPLVVEIFDQAVSDENGMMTIEFLRDYDDLNFAPSKISKPATVIKLQGSKTVVITKDGLVKITVILPDFRKPGIGILEFKDRGEEDSTEKVGLYSCVFTPV